MSAMWLSLSTIVALTFALALGLFALLFGLRVRRLTRSRLGRAALLARLGARLSVSWLGVALRRRFVGAAARQRLDAAQRQAAATALVESMGHMKGAIMKLGQLLSFVSDDVPEELRTTLASLQTAAPPLAFPVIRAVVEEELRQPIERLFARFDERPLAAASIGQVHAATLPSGDEVVVKVQYPGVAAAIGADLATGGALAALLRPLFPGLDSDAVVAELGARIGEELDYLHEAEAQATFGRLYDGHPFICIPRVYASHSTGRLLTSERIFGRSFAEVLALDEPTRCRYGEILFRFVFGSIFRHGLFNGDPHPGNYLFTTGGRVAFLDFGCTKRFPPALLEHWRGLVAARLAGEPGRFAEKLVAIGFLPADHRLDPELLFRYFAYFYEPIADDAEFTFTRAYNARAFAQIFRPSGEFAGLGRRLDMPGDWVFVNRLQWGVYSVLATLGARANFQRIEREYLFGDPPSSALGEADAAFEAARGRPSRASA